MTEGAPKKEVCGLVMPISVIDGLSESHWAEVRAILTDSIEKAGFIANLVSNADDVGIIQKRIIQNLYDNPVAVVDVSTKNPNVMFELGMRLAFDKPTVIVKDDETTYSFDTAPIEHLVYPRDLRFAEIVKFEEKLTEKVRATYEKATTDPNYTTFLKHFGQFTVVRLDKIGVSGQEYILEELKYLRSSIDRLQVPRVPFGKQIISDNAKDWVGMPALSVRLDSEAETVAFKALAQQVLKSRGVYGSETSGDVGTIVLRSDITSQEAQKLADTFRAAGFKNVLLAG